MCRQAADKGHVEAQYQLGMLYQLGAEGVPHDRGQVDHQLFSANVLTPSPVAPRRRNTCEWLLITATKSSHHGIVPF